MSKSNCPTTFDAISRFNHWIVAIAMIGMLGFGLYLENIDLARSVKGPLIGLHKSMGVLILIYGIWRVGYRLRQGFPEALGHAPAWQEIAAKTVHWTLLAGVIIMPLSGLVMSVFGGRPVNVFDILSRRQRRSKRCACNYRESSDPGDRSSFSGRSQTPGP
jgi:cytochrome b561